MHRCPWRFQELHAEQRHGNLIILFECNYDSVHRSIIENEHPDYSAPCHYLKIFFFPQSLPDTFFIKFRADIFSCHKFPQNETNGIQKAAFPATNGYSIRPPLFSEKDVFFQKGATISVLGKTKLTAQESRAYNRSNFKTFTQKRRT